VARHLATIENTIVARGFAAEAPSITLALLKKLNHVNGHGLTKMNYFKITGAKSELTHWSPLAKNRVNRDLK
jgi:hypothetical protein